MYTIDLLKGEGVPEQSSPEKIAVMAVTIVVPVVVAILMFGLYLSNRVAISVLSTEADSYQKKVENLSVKLVVQKSLDTEKQLINQSIIETANSINRHTQWTDILITALQHMPDSLVLTRMSAEQRIERAKVPNPNKPGEKMDIAIPARTLTLNLGTALGSNADSDIREFRDKLRYSSVLAPKLEDIVVSQQGDSASGREIISYEIKCIFKPQI